MIEFKCPYCAKPLKLPHSYAGRAASCPACLRSVSVPGGPAETVPASASKPRIARQQLCVDCGRTVSSADAMEHDGQVVCTPCHHLREGATEANAGIAAKAKAAMAAKAKRAAKATPGRRRKRILWTIILAAVALTGVIVWLVLW